MSTVPHKLGCSSRQLGLLIPCLTHHVLSQYTDEEQNITRLKIKTCYHAVKNQ